MIPDPHDRPTLSVEEAGRLCGLARSAAYDQAARYIATDGAEGLPVLKFGRRLVVPTARLLAMLGFENHETPPASGASVTRLPRPSDGVGGSG